MPRRDWDDDDELLRDIGDALRSRRTEGRVLEAARQIRVWRTAALDRTPAVLLYDSQMDRVAAGRIPRQRPARSLIFALGEARVEVELTASSLDGRLIPPTPGVVRLLDPSGPVAETTADTAGSFTVTPLRSGPIRIECVVAGRRLATQWIRV